MHDNNSRGVIIMVTTYYISTLHLPTTIPELTIISIKSILIENTVLMARRYRRFLESIPFISQDDEGLPSEPPGTFKEGTPRRNTFKRFKYPNLSKFQVTLKDQAKCLFFRLPVEIRELIYNEIWRTAGLRQHILIRNGYYTHIRCITDHNAPDERQVEVGRLWGTEIRPFTQGLPSNGLWNRRLNSGWSNHWKCEERAASRSSSTVLDPAPFLPMLLVCKQM